MATLTQDAMRAAADAARAESRALCAESRKRRFELRRSTKAVEETRGACVAKLSWLEGRELLFRSAWSELLWHPPGHELDHVLVSHDGDI
jgi:hypothetical protein